MTDYREIIDRIDLRQLIAPGKAISGNKPVMIFCPYHEETAQSCAIYNDHLWCFGCQNRKSTLEWIAENEGMDLETSFREVVNTANDKYVGIISVKPLPQPIKREIPVTVILEPMNPLFAKYCHDQLGEKREWFFDRGLLNGVIDEQLLGYYNGAFSIPVWRPSGDLVTMRYRRDDEVNTKGPKYWGTRDRNVTMLYNSVALSRECSISSNHTVVITEGELDCLILLQSGINAVSFTNGVGSFHKEFVANFARFSKIIIAFDMDSAGQKEAKRVEEMFP